MTAVERAVPHDDEPVRHVVHVALTFEVDDAPRLRTEFVGAHPLAPSALRTLDVPLVHHLVASIDADLLELHGIRHVGTGFLRSRRAVQPGPARPAPARHPHRVTPSSLAIDLGHGGPGRVRAFLRDPDDGGPAFEHRRGSHWRLDAAETDRVRRRFDGDASADASAP